MESCRKGGILSFKRKKLAVTPLSGSTFLLSSEGEVKLVLNPPRKREFEASHGKLAEAISLSQTPIALPDPSEEEIPQSWPQNLVIVPGPSTSLDNAISLRKEELFELEADFTLTFPSVPESEGQTPLIVIKAWNLHLLYTSSLVRIEDPPHVDLLLIPRSVLGEALAKAASIHHLPLYVGCETGLTITGKEGMVGELAEIPGLNVLPLSYSLEVIRHLSSVKVLGVEEDLSQVVHMLDFM